MPEKPSCCKFYISFGFSHVHKIGDVVLDHNCLLEVEAEDKVAGRAMAWKLFGAKWSFIYDEIPNMIYFPRGIVRIGEQP